MPNYADLLLLSVVEARDGLRGEPELTCEAEDPGCDEGAAWAVVARCCGRTMDLCQGCAASYRGALAAFAGMRQRGDGRLGDWACKSCSVLIEGPVSFEWRRL